MRKVKHWTNQHMARFFPDVLSMKSNIEILHDPKSNKSTAFTKEEREKYGLRGLLPYAISTQQKQIERIMENLSRKSSDIEKYVFLSALQDRNERLFYKVVEQHISEVMPLIYTPTVGEACREFSHIFRQTKGFYITPDDKGQIRKMLDNWPETDVRAIVITDGQRILGLGDLGANGMGIPIGKLSLYVACAGIHPHQCLPVMLDAGTNNEELLKDPLYLGYPHKRIAQEQYLELIDEFVSAVRNKYPRALIQFEDFLTPNAFLLIEKYKEKILCFNDDIQGTAAVALAGVLASSRLSGTKFRDCKIMFLGAGSAATGIADLMVSAFRAEGFSAEEARKKLWFVDINGLIVASRNNLMPHNVAYAHEEKQMNFIDAVEKIKPNVLIGASGAGGTFTKEVIEKMCALNERPLIFALSNPTAQAECTAQQAYTWSDGRAIFASGSPFSEVNYKGVSFRAGQANNVYVFPGLALGTLTAQLKTIPEAFFLAAAHALAELVSEEDLSFGSVYPPLNKIRETSVHIATAVAKKAFETKCAQVKEPDNLSSYISSQLFDPGY